MKCLCIFVLLITLLLSTNQHDLDSNIDIFNNLSNSFINDNNKYDNIEIEVIELPKNLNHNKRSSFPHRAFSHIDNIMDLMLDSLLDSILPSHISSKVINPNDFFPFAITNTPHAVNENELFEKEFDDFFEESEKAIDIKPVKKSRRNKKLKLKKNKQKKAAEKVNLPTEILPEEINLKDKKATTTENDTSHSISKFTEKIQNQEKEKINKTNSTNWYKDFTIKKLLTSFIKVLTYITALILIIFVFYYLISSIFFSNKFSKEEKEKYTFDELDDELKSINKSKSSFKLY